MKKLSLAEAAEVVGGELVGPARERPDHLISGVSTLVDASDSELSFLSNQRYKESLAETSAAAVLLSPDQSAPASLAIIRVEDPYLAFAKLQRYFHPQTVASGRRDATASIDATAQLADDVDVAANAVIGAGVTIGAGAIIGAGCAIGERVYIGSRCLLHANSVVASDCVLGDGVILQPGAVVGSDGFGYAWAGDNFLKIPQVGRVVIEDDAEIGANATIDRGAIGDTMIERGVKIDNLVQVGHNVRVGAYTVMASQVGISGSTQVGKGCQLGGQAGLAGHIQVGDGVKLAAKSGVISDLKSGGTYAGFPAMPHRVWLKTRAVIQKLPELWKSLHKQ